MKKWMIMICILLLTGCDYKELNEISISTVLGIDKNNEEYTITSLIVGKGENETIIETGTGTSLTTAFSNLNLNLSENLYLNHVQTIIISDQIAKEGLNPILDYFVKNDSIQNSFYLFLAHKVSAQAILQTLLESHNSDYNTITNIFKYNDEIEFSDKTDNIDEFLDTLLEKGKEPTLNTVTISNDKVTSSKLAIFRNDKLKGFSENSMGIAVLSNHANHIIIHIPCETQNSVVEINQIHVQTKINNNQIQNDITGNITLKENACQFQINNKVQQKILIQKAEKEVQKILKQSTNEIQNLKSDIFGYGSMLYKKNKQLHSNYISKLKIHNKLTLKIQNKEGRIYHE